MVNLVNQEDYQAGDHRGEVCTNNLSTKQRSQGQANQAQASHLLSLTMSRMDMSTRIQGQALQNPKSGLLSSKSPLSASAISASKTSEETFLEVVVAAGYLCSSSDISEVLMVVLAVCSFPFSAF